MILLENFYEDSRGNERSAGVIEIDYTDFFSAMSEYGHYAIKIVREGNDSLHLFWRNNRIYMTGKEEVITSLLKYLRDSHGNLLEILD